VINKTKSIIKPANCKCEGSSAQGTGSHFAVNKYQ